MIKTNEKKSILLVDDHKIIRDGIRFILEERDDYVVSDCSTAQTALHTIASNSIDLIITDVNMKNMDGLDLSREIKKNWPDKKILVLTMNKESSLIKEMLNVGVNGYIVKDSGREEILAALDSIFQNEYYFSKEAAMAITLRHTKENLLEGELTPLSEREKEVLTLIAKEYTNKEIGEELFISVRTVDAHRRNLLEKIGAKNTAGLVRYAYVNKMVEY